jgi:hypothetical protein
MFPEQLKKILELVKRTGDRVVIYDGANPDDSYVVMDFDSYAALVNKNGQPVVANTAGRQTAPVLENIPAAIASAVSVNLTEEDLTDKINREILMWKNKENTPEGTEDNRPKKAWQIPPTVKDKAQEVE